MTVCMAEVLQSGMQASCASSAAPSNSLATSPQPFSSSFSCCSTPQAKLLVLQPSQLLLPLPLLPPLLLLLKMPAVVGCGRAMEAKSACVMSSAAVLMSGSDSRADLQGNTVTSGVDCQSDVSTGETPGHYA